MQVLALAAAPAPPAPDPPIVSLDLIQASYRSDTFPQDWSEERRVRGAERYRKWLRLKLLHPNAQLAPTRDIDLYWHLHMLAPVAYHRDCMRLFGRLLDHDGGFGKDPAELPALREVFARTATWWEQEYGEPYPDDGAWFGDGGLTKCWHDCQSRCWHACSQ